MSNAGAAAAVGSADFGGSASDTANEVSEGHGKDGGDKAGLDGGPASNLKLPSFVVWLASEVYNVDSTIVISRLELLSERAGNALYSVDQPGYPGKCRNFTMSLFLRSGATVTPAVQWLLDREIGTFGIDEDGYDL